MGALEILMPAQVLTLLALLALLVRKYDAGGHSVYLRYLLYFGSIKGSITALLRLC